MISIQERDMNTNPFSKLLHSRRFWILTFDAIIAIATLFASTYATPQTQQFILGIIAIIQAPVIFVIKGITDQNIADINNNNGGSI